MGSGPLPGMVDPWLRRCSRRRACVIPRRGQRSSFSRERRHLMAAIRTPGITIDADGRFFIDKRYRAIRIGMRVGRTTQEQAEQCLRKELAQVDLVLANP